MKKLQSIYIRVINSPVITIIVVALVVAVATGCVTDLR
jgi:ABC-type transport system involved in cytochrome bd biosynthesis fused ATPase/permease subunit